MLKIGMKVAIPAEMNLGIGQVMQASSREILVRFSTSARGGTLRKFMPAEVKRRRIPEETRCYYTDGSVQRYGRVLMERGPDPEGFLKYLVRFPESKAPQELREDRFLVRSYIADTDGPVETLADLAHETPFFFEHRAKLLHLLLKQKTAARGFTALLSSRVLLFRHQIEVVARVATDPIIRYLLADEVGLGKTIETGIVLRQVLLDAPNTRVGVYTPATLMRQWEGELKHRFGLGTVQVLSHSQLVTPAEFDLVVIDEAHRVVAEPDWERGAQRLAISVKHLLLLTATPGLHNVSALLALLHLLDPQNYASAKQTTFTDSLGRRGELGRAILALQTSTLPALIQRQIRQLTVMLPEDRIVRQWADSLASGVDLGSVRDALLLHLTETYRLHRRMLRTRRVWLAENDRYFVRRINVACEYELDEAPFVRLWGILEEWRMAVAGRLEGDAVLFATGADAYVQLAETIASEPSKLQVCIQTAVERLRCTKDERDMLEELAAACDAEVASGARANLLAIVVKSRLARFSKGVVFCPARYVKSLGNILTRQLGRDTVLTTETGVEGEVATVAERFAHGSHRVLVADVAMEEGFNLQLAEFLVFYDLPWSPMRLEQRIGRLDRIDRIGPIECTLVITGEDEALCVDEAWRQLVTEGLGIFKQSISDLQHLIDAGMGVWRAKLFATGPAGIGGLVAEIQAQVTKERNAIDEQDAIDGMSRTAAAGAVEASLREADTTAPDFQRALALYLTDNMGLYHRWREEDNTHIFMLSREASPRVPMEKLGALREMLNRPVTMLRQVAVETFSAEFLRVGHSAIAACEDLIEWDDRGRAFALWRRVPEISSPTIVFRCLVRVAIDLQDVRKLLAEQKWDAIECGGLLRLLAGWFGEFYEECFLDPQGCPVSAPLVAICQLPYMKPRDQNLGKDRARDVQSEFGAETWAQWCQVASTAARSQVALGPTLLQRKEQARINVTLHFDLVRARLTARQMGGFESPHSIQNELARQKDIEQLIHSVLQNPRLYLDTMGAYVLSARPIGEIAPG